MNKIVKRFMIFFLGIPVLLSLLVFFPQRHHLLFNLLVIVFSALGAVEFRDMLAKKNLVISLPEALILGAIIPSAVTAGLSLGVTGPLVPAAFVLGASWFFISRIFAFSAKGEPPPYIGTVAAGLAVMVYPGLFMSWIVHMAAFPHAAAVLIVFLLIVFLNDSAAWAAGNLFGKNNRGIVAVSPNKSLAGFAGGLLAAALTGIAAAILIPKAFTPAAVPSVPAGVLLGLGAGIAATLGDLSESALKRGAGVKDSGSLIMGRGGVLDSIDSLAMAAPVYYLIYQVLF